MLPTRKIREIKETRNNKISRKKKDNTKDSIVQRGGSVENDNQDYKAPGFLRFFTQYSISALQYVVNFIKNLILTKLNITSKPGESSLELYKEVNAVLQNPEVKREFLEFLKNIVDKGLLFAEVVRPLMAKYIDLFVEIMTKMFEETGQGVVEASKDIISMMPVAGNVMTFVFLFDDIVKYFQSTLQSFMETGTGLNEIFVNAVRQLKDRDLIKVQQDTKNIVTSIQQRPAAPVVAAPVPAAPAAAPVAPAPAAAPAAPAAPAPAAPAVQIGGAYQKGGGKKRLLKLLDILKEGKRKVKNKE